MIADRRRRHPSAVEGTILDAITDRCWPLTAVQREIWLSQQLDPQNAKYNIAEYLRISGHIDVPAFRAAV